MRGRQRNATLRRKEFKIGNTHLDRKRYEIKFNEEKTIFFLKKKKGKNKEHLEGVRF